MGVESRPIQINTETQAIKVLTDLGIKQTTIKDYLLDKESALNIYQNLISSNSEDLALVEIVLGVKLDAATPNVIQVTYAVDYFANKRNGNQVDENKQRRKDALAERDAKLERSSKRKALATSGRDARS